MGYSIQPQTGTPAALQAAAGRRRGPMQLSDHPFLGPAAPADPYAAIIAGLPKPLTGAQITSQAQGELDPLVQAVTKQIGGQTAAATHAIGGFTADAANKLAGIDFAAPYKTGEQGQAAVDAALRQQLSGAGSADADQLAQRLAVINDPSVAAAAGALIANGAANGTTQVAQGSASLGNLIANAASASEFGAKQPGITRLAGIQNIAAAGQQGQAAIAAKAAELEAQLPQIISNLQSRNDSRSTAIASARQNQIARNDAISAGAAATANKNATTDANNLTKLQIAEMNANGKASAAQATQARSDRAYRLQFSKTWGYDPVNGNLRPGYSRTAAGQVVKTTAVNGVKANGVKPPTANEINTWVDAWKNGKPTTTTVQAPKPDANGNPVYRNITQKTGKLTYIQAYQRLRALNVTDGQARTYLDTAWKRGEQGRGWLSNEEQHALKQAALPPRAYQYKGVGYIDPKQAAALKAAGIQMPPGQWIQGSTSTKDLGQIYVIEQTY